MRYVHVTGVPTCALPISGPDNPYLHDHDHLRWPMDILGDRGAQIADGAQLVQAATDLEKVAAAVGVGAADEVGRAAGRGREHTAGQEGRAEQQPTTLDNE